MKKTYTLSLEGIPVFVKEEDDDFEFNWKDCHIIIDREENLVIPEMSCKEKEHGDTKKLFSFAYDHAHDEHIKKGINIKNISVKRKKHIGTGLNTYETRYFRNYDF